MVHKWEILILFLNLTKWLNGTDNIKSSPIKPPLLSEKENPNNFHENEKIFKYSKNGTDRFSFKTNKFIFLVLIRKSKEKQQELELLTTFYENISSCEIENILPNLKLVTLTKEKNFFLKVKVRTGFTINLTKKEDDILMKFISTEPVEVLNSSEQNKRVSLLNEVIVRTLSTSFTSLFDVEINEKWWYLLVKICELNLTAKILRNKAIIECEAKDISFFQIEKTKTRAGKIGPGFYNYFVPEIKNEHRFEIKNNIYWFIVPLNLQLEETVYTLSMKLNCRNEGADLTFIEKNLFESCLDSLELKTKEVAVQSLLRKFGLNDKQFELEILSVSAEGKNEQSFLDRLLLIRVNNRFLFHVMKVSVLQESGSELFQIEGDGIGIKIQYSNKKTNVSVIGFSVLGVKSPTLVKKTSRKISRNEHSLLIPFLTHQTLAFDPKYFSQKKLVGVESGTKNPVKSDSDSKIKTDSSKRVQFYEQEHSNENDKETIVVTGIVLTSLVLAALLSLLLFKLFKNANTLTENHEVELNFIDL